MHRQKRSPIHSSVGESGTNLTGDVATVQHLINASAGVPRSPLAVDGRSGPATIFAIRTIQRRFLHMSSPDGRIDPHGETIRFLAGPHMHATDQAHNAPQSHSAPANHAAPHAATAAASTPATLPATGATVATPVSGEIAWGGKVSSDFKAKVIKICKGLQLDPDFLMSCMAFESGETFSPSVKNPHSSATGLIQFMDATAKGLGTTTAALAKMSAVDQLDYVEKYFKSYAGKLKTIEDTYMVILYPKAVGKENTYAVFTKPSKMYDVNSGLDADNDGIVTKAEAGSAPAAKLKKGLKPGNRG
jgi:hypothetical protein